MEIEKVLFGYLGDVLSSRRAVFVAGLLIIFLSTLAFAVATRLWMLLAARLLQGMSSAVVTTIGYVLLTDVVGPERLGTAMGFTTMALSMALMTGPVIGGFLYDSCGYFAVFYPMFGLLALELVLRLMVVEGKGEVQSSLSPSDWPPATVDTSQASTNNAASDESDRTESQPLMDPAIKSSSRPLEVYWAFLSSPRFMVVLIGVFIQDSIASGFDSTVTPHLRDAFGYHASTAAFLFLTAAAPMLLSPLLGALTDHLGPRIVTSAGLLLAIPAYIFLAVIKSSTATPLPKLVGSLVLMGCSWALAMPPLRVELGLVVKQLEEEQPGRFGPKGAFGRAWGLINLVVATAGLVGPLYSGFVRISAGWRVLFFVNAGLTVPFLVLVILITGGKWNHSEQKDRSFV